MNEMHLRPELKPVSKKAVNATKHYRGKRLIKLALYTLLLAIVGIAIMTALFVKQIKSAFISGFGHGLPEIIGGTDPVQEAAARVIPYMISMLPQKSDELGRIQVPAQFSPSRSQ